MNAKIEHCVDDEVVIGGHHIAENELEEGGSRFMWSISSIRMILDGAENHDATVWYTSRYDSMLLVMDALDKAEDRRLLGPVPTTLASPNL